MGVWDRCLRPKVGQMPPSRGSRSLSMVHAVLGRLGHAARSFSPRYTQMRPGARSFFSDPRQGLPHLPARLMLHAVFGASETACTVPQLRVAWGEAACTVPQLRVAWGEAACTVPQLRVAWGETACTVPQLREPCAGGLCQGKEVSSSSSLPLSPAAHVVALRQPNPTTHTYAQRESSLAGS